MSSRIRIRGLKTRAEESPIQDGLGTRKPRKR